MKTNQLIYLIIILFVISISCKKVKIAESSKAISNLSGKWKLVEVFMGDIITPPCFGSTFTPNITLEFTANTSGTNNLLTLKGKSTVNEYFGNYQADSNGVIKISTIGGTKRGGSAEMMECENNYYTSLMAAQAYKIIETKTNPVKTILQLGDFRNQTGNPEMNGYYLIFEKLK